MSGITENKFTLKDIVNDFGVFYEYMFIQMHLPTPTEAQLAMASYLGRTDVTDKMLLALRGLG